MMEKYEFLKEYDVNMIFNLDTDLLDYFYKYVSQNEILKPHEMTADYVILYKIEFDHDILIETTFEKKALIIESIEYYSSDFRELIARTILQRNFYRSIFNKIDNAEEKYLAETFFECQITNLVGVKIDFVNVIKELVELAINKGLYKEKTIEMHDDFELER